MGKLWMYKWPLVLILLAVITDYYALTKYLFLLNSIDDQAKLITPLSMAA